MNTMMTKFAASVALTGLAALTGGCATTGAGADRPRTSYDIPSEELAGPQPPKAKTVYGMARLLRAQGDVEKAELMLFSIMKEYPEFSPTYNDLAEIRLERGHLDQAKEFLDRGLAVAPNDPVLLNNAGVCALLQHDYDTAVQRFQRASALAPHKERYRANVALAMGLRGDVEGSYAMYQQVVSRDDAKHNAEIIQQLIAPQADRVPTD